MFFRYRRPSLLTFLMVLVGFKVLAKKDRWSESERAEYRAKARSFRSKLREACAVWDEDETESAEDRA